VTVVAAAPAANTVVTGVLAFLVVAGMAIALFFLLRSMNKQLRKVAPGPRWRGEPQKGQPGSAAASGSRQNGSAGAQPGPQDTV
jgi:hypothetical protein